MMKIKVAIQGIKGSFHHIAAKKLFVESVEVLECLTFDQAINAVVDSEVDAGIIAIENSIAGSILPNYALIDDFNLQIIDECYIDIQHHLMALEGSTLSTITEVHSHPMALLQCKAFFKNYPRIKLVEAKDTAEVARHINLNSIAGIAAIASEEAANSYGLQILERSIQTIEQNETRFVVVRKLDKQGFINNDKLNKASLKFELSHKRGSLATVLNVISDCSLNLTKIQSLPKIHTPWKYAFFVDVTFKSSKDFIKAKEVMSIMAENFKVLGVYKNAKND